jgi:hypothetical protein
MATGCRTGLTATARLAATDRGLDELTGPQAAPGGPSLRFLGRVARFIAIPDGQAGAHQLGADVGSARRADGQGAAPAVTGFFNDTATFGAGMAAVTLTSAGSFDVFVAKYDPAGTLLFAVQAGGPGFDLGNGIAVDGAGNSLVTVRSGAPFFDTFRAAAVMTVATAAATNFP